VAAREKDNRIFIKIGFAVRREHDKIEHSVEDIVTGTLLTSILAGTDFSTDTGTSMPALWDDLFATNRTRNQIARYRTGHVTSLTSVLARPRAEFLTGRTRLGAFVRTSRMCTLNLAWHLAK
jgi:hypothetical protein